jgi:hypothetical protein
MSEKISNQSSNVGPDGFTGKYYCSLRLFDYKRPTPFETSFEKHTDIINLPLPIQLYDPTATAFSQQDMGLVGDILNNSGIDNIAAGGLYRFFSNSPQLITSGIRRFTPDVVNRLVSAIGQASGFDSRNITTAIEQSLGAIANPNPTVKFNGPILRDASFTWYLNAKNQAESLKFEEIIKKLKSASLPSRAIKGSVGILNYPKLAQVNFYPWDRIEGTNFNNDVQASTSNKWGWTDKSIIRLKRCFISNVNVNYNPANVPSFYYDNSPVVIEISIGLKEIEYMMAGEWSATGIKFDDGTASDSSVLIDRAINEGKGVFNNLSTLSQRISNRNDLSNSTQ